MVSIWALILLASSMYRVYVCDVSPKYAWFTKEVQTGANFSIAFAIAIARSWIDFVSDLTRLIVGFFTLTWVAHVKSLPAAKAIEPMKGTTLNDPMTSFFSHCSCNTCSIIGTRTLRTSRISPASLSETLPTPWNANQDAWSDFRMTSVKRSLALRSFSHLSRVRWRVDTLRKIP